MSTLVDIICISDPKNRRQPVTSAPTIWSMICGWAKKARMPPASAERNSVTIGGTFLKIMNIVRTGTSRYQPEIWKVSCRTAIWRPISTSDVTGTTKPTMPYTARQMTSAGRVVSKV